MTKQTKLNIISKLNYKKLPQGEVAATFYDDNIYPALYNKYGSVTLLNDGDNKYLSFNNDYAKIVIDTLSTNVKNTNFQLACTISLSMLRAENVLYAFPPSNTNLSLKIVIKNSFKNGLTIVSNNMSISTNYRFEINKLYKISISKEDDVYSLYIDGVSYGYKVSPTFTNNIQAGSNLIFGSYIQQSGSMTYNFRGNLYNANVSFGPTLINYNSYTKYGNNLISRLYFGNMAYKDTAAELFCGVDTVYGSNINWSIPEVSINSDAAVLSGGSFKTSLTNAFTLSFYIKNKYTLENISLLSYNNYKLLINIALPIIPEPETVINQYTTSAIEFENGLFDDINTTVWELSGNGRVQENNIIYNKHSFETTALGDSLYTTNNIISGGAVPFTIEFYALISKQTGWADASYIQAPLISKNSSGASTNQQIHINFANGGKSQIVRQANIGNGILDNMGTISLKYNEINKYTLTYDGAALRLFVNDKLDNIVGTSAGIVMSPSQPFTFFDTLVPSYSQYRTGSTGIIDNINIHDTVAINPISKDLNAEYLIADLPFDGENGSNRIVDQTPDILYEDHGDPFKDYVVDDFNFNFNTKNKKNNPWSVVGSPGLGDGYVILNMNAYIYRDIHIGDKPITIEFFVTALEESASGYSSSILQWGTSTDATDGFGIERYLTTQVMRYRKAYGTIETMHSDTIPLNKPAHVAFCFDGNSYYCFVNGVRTNLTIPNNANTKRRLSLGWCAGSWMQSKNKVFTDFKITEGIIKYSDNFVPPKPRTVWRTAGAATLVSSTSFDGISSLYLPATTDYVFANKNNFNLRDVDFTISFKCKKLSDTKWNVLLSSANLNETSDNSLIAIGIKDDATRSNKLYVMGTSVNGSRPAYISKTELLQNIEYKVDIICKNKILYFYINDKFDNIFMNYTNSIDFTKVSNQYIYLGYCTWNTPDSFTGYIKDFKVYKGKAIFPTNNTGKICLEFNNNINDKYGNSTWTNSGVTFDLINSVKGHAAYFGNGTQRIYCGANNNFNYGNNNFLIEMDMKATQDVSYSVILGSTTSSNTGCHISRFGSATDKYCLAFGTGSNVAGRGGQLFLNNYYNIKTFRKNQYVMQKINDVITVSRNYNATINVNFNDNNGTQIGHGWAANSALNKYVGYLDNVYSHKDDPAYLNSTIYLGTNVRINLYDESLFTTYTGSSATSTYGTVVFDDSPSLSDFIAELEIFIKSDASNHGILNFRTADYSLNNMDRFGYSAYISGQNIKFGKGGSSWSELGNKVIPIQYQDNAYHKLTVIANSNNFKMYIDNELLHDITDTTYTAASKFAWCTYLPAGWANVSSRIKSIKISDLDNNEIYYKDWKTPIADIVIDQPAVHLPLESNVINIGYAPIAPTTNGTPIYETVDGKKCIKFENGKYIQIPTHDIFDVGIDADFYIEFDMYLKSHKNWNYVLSTFNTYTQSFSVYCESNGKIYLREGQTDILASADFPLLTFNNIKIYRKNGVLYFKLNDENIPLTKNVAINFSKSNLRIGTSQWGVSTDWLDGYMANLKLFVGTAEIPSTYNEKKILDLDFKPTRKSYLFKDNNNKCIIHPTAVTQREYSNSRYGCAFNGSSNFLELGKNDALNFGFDDCVIEIVFMPKTQTAEWGTLIGHSQPSATSMDFLMVTRSGTIECRVNNTGITTNSSVKVVYNEINNLLFVRKNKNITIKLNEIVIFDGICEDPFNLNKNDNTYIGKNGWDGANGYFCGTIYSIKILRNTTDLSLLEDISADIEGETIIDYTLTNGEDSVTLTKSSLDENYIQFVKSDDKVVTLIDNKKLEVPIVGGTIENNELELFNEYKGQIKDLRLYNIAFEDRDVLEYNGPYDTELAELEELNCEEDVDEPVAYDQGDYIIQGYIEGISEPHRWQIIHKMNNVIIAEGFGINYYYDGIPDRFKDDYEIHDYTTGKIYPVEDKGPAGAITVQIGVNLCAGSDLCIKLYQRDNSFLVGIYELDTTGSPYICRIPNLDTNKKYDVMLFDRLNNIESRMMSDRSPIIDE